MLNQPEPAAWSGKPEIAVRLRAATARFHDAAELAMNLPASIESKADYVRLLGMLWTFYAPLEARLDAIAGLSGALPDWPARHKAQLLAADLARLGAGLPAPSSATSAALEGVGDVAAAFGALYVVEGATLGGAVVGPQIRATLAGADDAFAFYDSYGKEIGPRWRGFVTALANEAGAGAAASREILAAACLTFETFLAHVTREAGSARKLGAEAP